MTFALHPRLAADTLPVGDLGLCTVRLMNDARFPWLILVPRRPDAVELYDLTAAERSQCMEETASAARALAEVTSAFKMNVGAIGNIVSQLHIHVVARHEDDLVWPAPVWGTGPSRPYEAEAAQTLVDALSATLAFH